MFLGGGELLAEKSPSSLLVTVILTLNLDYGALEWGHSGRPDFVSEFASSVLR